MSTVFSTKRKIGACAVVDTSLSVNNGKASTHKDNSDINYFEVSDLMYADGYRLFIKSYTQDDNILNVEDEFPSWHILENSFEVKHNNTVELLGCNEAKSCDLMTSSLVSVDKKVELVEPNMGWYKLIIGMVRFSWVKIQIIVFYIFNKFTVWLK